MNIEQKSIYRELSEEDCTMVQGGFESNALSSYSAILHQFKPTCFVEEAEKPGNE